MPHKNLWTVTPEWLGETVYIIAGGPSVLKERLSLLNGRRVIVVNSSYEAYPHADIMFYGDQRWLMEHCTRPAFVGFKGRKVTINSQELPDYHPLRLRQMKPDKCGGFSTDRTGVAGVRTNLQGAMNLAAHLGAARIVLLGADMKRAENGRTHHHAAHPWKPRPGNVTWDIQMTQLRLIAKPLADRNIEVINTSLESRIDWWPKLSLAQALLLERKDLVKKPPRRDAIKLPPLDNPREEQGKRILQHLARKGIGPLARMPHDRRS